MGISRPKSTSSRHTKQSSIMACHRAPALHHCNAETVSDMINILEDAARLVYLDICEFLTNNTASYESPVFP